MHVVPLLPIYSRGSLIHEARAVRLGANDRRVSRRFGIELADRPTTRKQPSLLRHVVATIFSIGIGRITDTGGGRTDQTFGLYLIADALAGFRRSAIFKVILAVHGTIRTDALFSGIIEKLVAADDARVAHGAIAA